MGTSRTLVFGLASTLPTPPMLSPGSTSEYRRPALAPLALEASSAWTPSAFLTLPCLLALCERSLSHSMRVNHSVSTTSSLSFSRDQMIPPCSSIASFPLPSSQLTISFVQQAAWDLIFTPRQTRQHALKSFPPPYLIQILQPSGDELVLWTIWVTRTQTWLSTEQSCSSAFFSKMLLLNHSSLCFRR